MAEILGDKTLYGAIITDVEKNSPAEKSGMIIGDIILELNGKKMTHENDLLSVVSRLKVGETVNMKILRDQKKNITLKVKLGQRSNDNNVDSNIKEYKDFGLQIKEIPVDIQRKYNIKGVIVVGINNNNESNIKKGDIILQLDNKSINGLEDFDRIMAECLKKKKERIFVLIDQNEVNVFTVIKKVAQ